MDKIQADAKVAAMLDTLHHPDVVKSLIRQAAVNYAKLKPAKGKVKRKITNGRLELGTDTLHDIVLCEDDVVVARYRYDAVADRLGILQAPSTCACHGFETKMPMEGRFDVSAYFENEATQARGQQGNRKG